MLKLTKPDIRVALDGHAAFMALTAKSPEILTRDACRAIVAHARRHGARSRFLGDIGANEVVVHDDNYRESLHARGQNPRVRAVLDLIEEFVAGHPPGNVRILAHEAVTPLALLLRGRFAKAMCTEYAPNPEDQRAIFPIPHCDVTQSGLPKDSFDLVVSNDVFEHVPDLRAALADSCQVLRDGGKLIATFPFAYGDRDTIVRARFQNGAVVHLMEPEFHGNPIKPEEGSLVFQVPAWDVIDMCRAVGFSHAEMVFWSSHASAITGAEIAGVFILRATR